MMSTTGMCDVRGSDDLGQFRIAGLAPGEYLVKATMQVRSGFAMQRGVMNMAGLGADKPLVAYIALQPSKNAKPGVNLNELLKQ